MATKTNHTNTYYFTRSIVRFSFWMVVAGLVGTCFGLVLKATDNSLPECDVTLDISAGRFTWNIEDFPSLNPNMTIDDCRHPDDVVLDKDGTWDWFYPDL